MSPGLSTDLSQFALSNALRDQFEILIGHAIFAPSGHNTQPWFFSQAGDELDLIADRTRGLPVVDPYDRELTISCGAVLDHLVVASRHYGRDPVIDVCPETGNSDLLARFRLGKEVTPTVMDHIAFNAIPCRRTTRARFDDKVLPDDLSARCLELAERFDVELRLITDHSIRSDIADLVVEGDRLQFADPRFRRELGSWVHARRNQSKDGMSGASFGMPDVLSSVGGLVIRTFDIGKGVAAGDREKILNGSPTLAVLACPENSVSDWLTTGRALSEILLTLASAGATASFLNPPVELEVLKPRLRKLVGCKGVPQLLMRFGYGPAIEGSVRRKVSDVFSG